MIHRKLLMASAIIASVVATSCSDTTAPNQLAREGLSSKSSPRGGNLHVEKECSAYTGQAGDYCTITSSNLKQIEVGSRVIYAQAASGTSLDTDLVLDLPGPGNNIAFGHVVLDFVTNNGLVTFSGGTGKFTWFHASVAVSPLGGPNYAWDGRYSFSPRD